MKKELSMACKLLVLLFIADIFLLPFTASAQDLTAAQIKERCKNNIDRMAELEKQSDKLGAQLSKMWTNEDIENARDKMVFTRKMKDKSTYSEEELSKVVFIARRYNFIGNGERALNQIGNLTEFIAKKIDSATALLNKRPQLVNEKKAIDKQISNHLTNLIALGCVSSTSVGGCIVPNVAGTFITSGDPTGILILTQGDGKRVDGRYGPNEQSLGSNLNGNFECNILTGTYTNPKYKTSGKFTYTFSSDGSSFSGTWKNDKDGATGSISGTRK